jgi:DNA-binding MarR family transcriptional regulator
MNEELNRILHQPIRTQIMAYLIAHGSCTYTEIKNKFNLSDGHMTTHMRELLEHKYVRMEKEFINNKPCTTYYITDNGRNEFAEYVKRLKKIIETGAP